MLWSALRNVLSSLRDLDLWGSVPWGSIPSARPNRTDSVLLGEAEAWWPEQASASFRLGYVETQYCWRACEGVGWRDKKGEKIWKGQLIDNIRQSIRERNSALTVYYVPVLKGRQHCLHAEEAHAMFGSTLLGCIAKFQCVRRSPQVYYNKRQMFMWVSLLMTVLWGWAGLWALSLL